MIHVTYRYKRTYKTYRHFNELLANISKHMARHGLAPGAYVYVADSGFVTPDNLDKATIVAPKPGF